MRMATHRPAPEAQPAIFVVYARQNSPRRASVTSFSKQANRLILVCGVGRRDENRSAKVVQAMSPAQKLRAAERPYYSARQLKAAALRAQHPDWTEESIRQAVRQIFLHARS
jgi:hypothetical protein